MEHSPDFTREPRHRLSDVLVDRIQASIACGELRVGDQLPSILEMARTFHVASSTVREALIRLEGKQLIEIRHGSGVFVTSNRWPIIDASAAF